MQRALRLLEAVGSHPAGAPAKQLAREAGLPLPTAYHLLRTLAHEGYLRRENGVFVLGEAAVRLAAGGAMQRRDSWIEDSLPHWREALGVPVYFAVYRSGEMELVAVADGAYETAADERADFRETGHAHAIGQCLLSQLDAASRRDHLDRHPVQPVTPYTVPDRPALLERLERLERLDATGRMRPVVEKQEYAVGTVCAAIPVMPTAGSTAAALAISLPLHQGERLLPAIDQLRVGVESLLSPFTVSISI
ncbi:IclR family transcriptional regulator [Streptomyces sp. NPDC057445]|uniref:IclR family transcriptional regulator n=1 Tax=Streptomyces sp. NPDC057445 TaxID=3346136 RepID=UPI0036C07FBF